LRTTLKPDAMAFTSTRASRQYFIIARFGFDDAYLRYRRHYLYAMGASAYGEPSLPVPPPAPRALRRRFDFIIATISQQAIEGEAVDLITRFLAGANIAYTML